MVLLALAPLAENALSIETLTAVVLTALISIPSFFIVVLLGLAQGLQRFPIVALGLGAPPVSRIVFVVALLIVGYSVNGAMGATLAASIVGVVLLAILLWRLINTKPVGGARAATKRDLYGLVPVVAGLLAIASLSTSDLVVAKSAFDDDLAGAYGAASLIGRVILYLPAAIVTVLLPKVAARAASKQASLDILSGSLLVTGGFCALTSLVYVLAPGFVVTLAFGSEYDDAVPLLPLFAVAMSGYALLNVLFTYHVGHSDWRMAWLLVGGGVVQLAGFALLHESPHQLLAVSAVTAGGLLLIHEVLLDSSLTRATRDVGRYLGRHP